MLIFEAIDTKSIYYSSQEEISKLINKMDYHLDFESFCRDFSRKLKIIIEEIYENFVKDFKSSTSIINFKGDEIFPPYFLIDVDINFTKNLFGASVQMNKEINSTKLAKFSFNLPLTLMSLIYNKSDFKKYILQLPKSISHEMTHLMQEYKLRNLQNSKALAAKNKQTKYASLSSFEDYLSSKHEVQAYAVNTAQELIEYYGDAETALKKLSTIESIENSDTLKRYYEKVKDYNKNAWKYYIKNVVLQLKNFKD